MTTSPIFWVWYFISTCQIRCSFRGGDYGGGGCESLEAALEVYRNYYEDADTHEDLLAVMKDELNYSIKPELTFTTLVARVNEGTFQLEDLAQGFRDIEQSDELYENLFEDIDLYSKS